MRILTPEQFARVIGGAVTVTTSTLPVGQMSDFRLGDQISDVPGADCHRGSLPPTFNSGDLGYTGPRPPDLPGNTGQIPPRMRPTPMSKEIVDSQMPEFPTPPRPQAF